MGTDPFILSPDARSMLGKLSDSEMAYGTFVKKYLKKKSIVTDEEHTVFLLYWLCKFLFCHPIVKISNNFVIIASTLTSGTSLALGKTMLALLYRDLAYASSSIASEEVSGVFGGPL